jgi:Flp pilus assembly protein TadG
MAIIEAGIMLPTLILMVCGTMDLARVFFAGIVVEAAARAGVQYGSYSVGKAGATSAIVEAAQNETANQGLTGITVSSRTFCGCSTSTAEVSCSSGTCNSEVPAGYVETTASYTFRPIVPYPGIPDSIVLRSAARFRAQ